MKKLIPIITLLLFCSCINENTLYTSFPIQLLNGNSAKVWILTKSSDLNDKNITAMNDYRRSFIFYSNDKFREQELINLGSNKGLKGRFTIEEFIDGEIILNLEYSKGEKAVFLIKEIKNNSLSLLNLDGSNITWKLKSLKPPTL